MKRTLIRYKTKPEAAAENERLVKIVFQELQAKAPEGVRYLTLKQGDGTFFHLVEVDADDQANPISELDAFRAFRKGIKERCLELPMDGAVTVVGNYRMLKIGKTE